MKTGIGDGDPESARVVDLQTAEKTNGIIAGIMASTPSGIPRSIFFFYLHISCRWIYQIERTSII